MYLGGKLIKTVYVPTFTFPTTTITFTTPVNMDTVEIKRRDGQYLVINEFKAFASSMCSFVILLLVSLGVTKNNNRWN